MAHRSVHQLRLASIRTLGEPTRLGALEGSSQWVRPSARRPREIRVPPAVTRTRQFVDCPGAFLALARVLSRSPLIYRRWPCSDVSSLRPFYAAALC
jgi:hypothetical protein